MILYHVILAAVVVGLPSPGAAGRCLSDVPDVNPKRFLNVEGQTLDIRLEVSRRISHRLSTHVFRIFLEEILGYSGVRVIDEEDYFNTTQVLDRLSGPEGDNQSSVPNTMVNLEVWIPPETNLVSWLDIKHVKDCGLVTPPGQFAWFIPSDLPVSHLVPNMDHWRILTRQNTAALFDVNDDQLKYIGEFTKNSTSNRYYCEDDFCENGMYVPEVCKSLRHKTQPCALLFAAYPDVTKFVVDDIRELKLFVKVVWVGPNLKEVADKLAKSYMKDKSNSSIIVLSWTPSEVVRIGGKTQYEAMTFPPCERTGSVETAGCKYQYQRLVKLAWAKLEKGANPAFEAIHKVHFSQENYSNLLDRYDKESQTKSMETLACDWLRDNPNTWQRWVPRTDEKNELFIFGIFPISGTGYTAKGIVKAALMAVDAVNANDSILRDYQLKLYINNGQCKADVVMKTFIDYILNKKYSKLVGVLGPACSETVEPLAGLTKHFKTVVISYSAEGSNFSDRTKYPYFFRTIGENEQYKDVYLRLFKHMGWRRVAALTEDGQKYTEYLSHMHDDFQKEGITIVNRKFPRDREKKNMTQYLEDFKSKNFRIIIGDVYDAAARAVMCEAYQLKMTAKQGYVWFLPLWLSPNWYNTDHYNRVNNETVFCNTSQMIEAVNGHLALTHSYFADDNAMMQENRTVGQWRKSYKDYCSSGKVPVPMSNYAGYAYDAVWVYANALDKLNKENQSYLTDIHSGIATEKYVAVLNKTDFQGVSGHVRFLRGGPSRVSTINVVQWLNNNTHIVGSYIPLVDYQNETIIGGDLSLNQSLFKWFTPDGQIPEDGTLAPSRCILYSLANALSVECDAAIVLVNLMGLAILLFLVLIAFMVIKRRYDKKVQQTQQKYMKSMGIDLLDQHNVPNLDKWEISRENVVINRKLGEGAFGTVYGGEAKLAEKGWIAVAVKTLKVGSASEEKLDFLSEAEVMKRFDHKNIVKLVGVCTKNEPVYTIMEFMLYGDLKNFLLGRRHLVNGSSEESDEISSKKLTMMALDVAKALSYLADLKYVHRDVASRNCLVNVNRVIKLGDFGMTRPMIENDYYKFNRKGMLPVRWMAPESLGLGIFTPRSDVWSFGVLLYEIITFGSFPFQGLSNNQVLEFVKQGNTLTIPAQIKPQLEGLIRSCWRLDYKHRPQASEIVEVLANNPRLIYPCLDVPLASVQMEDTGQFEINLPEKLRKCSFDQAIPKFGRDFLLDNSDNPFLFRDLLRTDSGTGSVIDNGCGPCVRDPLLGSPRSSTSSSGMGLTKYVMLEHRDAQCDEYCTHDPSPTAVSMV